jgi:transposase
MEDNFEELYKYVKKDLHNAKKELAEATKESWRLNNELDRLTIENRNKRIKLEEQAEKITKLERERDDAIIREDRQKSLHTESNRKYKSIKEELEKEDRIEAKIKEIVELHLQKLNGRRF